MNISTSIGNRVWIGYTVFGFAVLFLVNLFNDSGSSAPVSRAVLTAFAAVSIVYFGAGLTQWQKSSWAAVIVNIIAIAASLYLLIVSLRQL